MQFSTVSARIWDNDGDFLLIEAAYSLPKWLKPETSANRIWLKSGSLHVIPLPNKHHPTLPAAPTVQQALQSISSDSIPTKANSGMQQAIKARIKGYPSKAHTEMHRARCTLPARVAHLLRQCPQLVSPAVTTFHYRDIQDMKAAAKFASFPPQVSLCAGSASSQLMYTSGRVLLIPEQVIGLLNMHLRARLVSTITSHAVHAPETCLYHLLGHV